MMSQRFPNYFDGIVAAAPAMRTSFSDLGLRHAATALNAIAPLGADGKPETRAALSESDRRVLIDGILEACDALDGNRDGLIFAPQECHFDPAALACKDGQKDRCLTGAQVNAIRNISKVRTSSDTRCILGTLTPASRPRRGFPVARRSADSGRPACGLTMDVEAAWSER